MRTELRAARPATEVESLLLDIFGAADKAGEGMLPFPQLRDLVQSANLGLTRVQVIIYI